ncbi:MAG: hypothetical protein ACI4QE_05340 [Acutalibacteraceae bacterium]
MKKKISPAITIAIVAVVAAIAFTSAYLLAMNRFNSKVSDLASRQAMFSKLSEVDSAVRQNYGGDIPEDALENSTVEGYIAGLSTSDIKYIKAEKFDESKYSQKEYKVIKLTDGSAIVINISKTKK